MTALYLIAEPFLPGMGGRHLPAELLREHLAHGEAEAEAILAVGPGRSRPARGEPGRAARQRPGGPAAAAAGAPRPAQRSDLVGQPDLATHGVDDTALTEAAFMDSGRPALVIPREHAAMLPPRRALVAWDGSREAARATSDAIPLLRFAEQVLVLVVDARDDGRLGDLPGSALTAHLVRHAVKAELRQVASGSASVAETLLGHAGELQADLLVMGGYGHSRLREMMLGGTTRSMLEHMTVPVLFSH